jgi:hypothetical protein
MLFVKGVPDLLDKVKLQSCTVPMALNVEYSFVNLGFSAFKRCACIDKDLAVSMLKWLMIQQVQAKEWVLT